MVEYFARKIEPKMESKLDNTSPKKKQVPKIHN